MPFCDFLGSQKSIAVATALSGERKCLFISVVCKSDFHRSLSLKVERMSSESVLDTSIYENVVEIKQERRQMGTWKADARQCKCRGTRQIFLSVHHALKLTVFQSVFTDENIQHRLT